MNKADFRFLLSFGMLCSSLCFAFPKGAHILTYAPNSNPAAPGNQPLTYSVYELDFTKVNSPQLSFSDSLVRDSVLLKTPNGEPILAYADKRDGLVTARGAAPHTTIKPTGIHDVSTLAYFNDETVLVYDGLGNFVHTIHVDSPSAPAVYEFQVPSGFAGKGAPNNIKQMQRLSAPTDTQKVLYLTEVGLLLHEREFSSSQPGTPQIMLRDSTQYFPLNRPYILPDGTNVVIAKAHQFVSAEDRVWVLVEGYLSGRASNFLMEVSVDDTFREPSGGPGLSHLEDLTLYKRAQLAGTVRDNGVISALITNGDDALVVHSHYSLSAVTSQLSITGPGLFEISTIRRHCNQPVSSISKVFPASLQPHTSVGAGPFASIAQKLSLPLPSWTKIPGSIHPVSSGYAGAPINSVAAYQNVLAGGVIGDMHALNVKPKVATREERSALLIDEAWSAWGKKYGSTFGMTSLEKMPDEVPGMTFAHFLGSKEASNLESALRSTPDFVYDLRNLGLHDGGNYSPVAMGGVISKKTLTEMVLKADDSHLPKRTVPNIGDGDIDGDCPRMLVGGNP